MELSGPLIWNIVFAGQAGPVFLCSVPIPGLHPCVQACESVFQAYGHEAVILMEALVDSSYGGALRSMRFLRSLRALRAVTAEGQGGSR